MHLPGGGTVNLGNPPGCDSPTPASRIGDLCRCIVCARCGHHTGNSHQGHFWSFCSVTGETRSPHMCCPGNCELENTGEGERWLDTYGKNGTQQ